MKKFALVIFLLGLLLNKPALAQLETSRWYFGNFAGLNFNTNPPAILTNGALNAVEGCASIADPLGNLLFYTDGSSVWNAQHLVMANGTGLFGNGTGTQPAIIIKQPGNTNLYYIFTVQAGNNAQVGHHYSIVDLTLAAGLGSVTVKNSPLHLPVCNEYLTATRHCNRVDYWVVGHERVNNNFRAYLLTAAGVSTTAVVSSIGAPSTNFGGTMKLSPNGKKLELTYYQGTNLVELFDFDNSTGVVSNSLALLANPSLQFYGSEFSPDGSKLYAARYGGNNAIYQWDLCAGNNAAVVASQTLIANSVALLGCLQLAIDGKVYLARNYKQELGVINNPNQPGAACNYSDVGQSIITGTSQSGLPAFPTNFFQGPPAPFSFSASCGAVSFSVPVYCAAVSYTPNSYVWDFGHPASGAANSSTLTSPSHNYPVGTYTAQLVVNYNCSSDTIKQQVTITTAGPSLSVSGNFSICPGQAAKLTASGASSYTWSTGPTTASVSLSPTVSTTYTIEAVQTPTGCIGTKTITVSVLKCTSINEPNDNGSISIYPNPNNSFLNIETQNSGELILIDQLGNVLLRQAASPGITKIDIGYLNSGVYILRVINGSVSKNYRIIKTD